MLSHEPMTMLHHACMPHVQGNSRSQRGSFTFLSREKKIETLLLGCWNSGEKEPKMTAEAKQDY